jgi:hypothetical protein
VFGFFSRIVSHALCVEELFVDQQPEFCGKVEDADLILRPP